jgi:outer membrane pore protein E
MTKRASGVATYRNTDFFGAVDGLDLTLQYQGKNEKRTASNRTATASVPLCPTTSAAARLL